MAAGLKLVIGDDDECTLRTSYREIIIDSH